MISRVNEPRQLYGLGSFVKKITKPIKKIVKSPIGKAALIGGGLWGLNKWGPLAGKIGPMFSGGWDKFKGLSAGKKALLGLGAAGVTLPFMAEEEEEIIETPWDETPSSIANLRGAAQDYYRGAPDYINSPFMPQKKYVLPEFYAAHGGRAGLLNGGQPGQAHAENMLKMQYQKYRNQGGTMSYQQFKMAILKQAQQQGPMAQEQAQPQMAAKGGRIGLKGGSGIGDFAKKHWGKASTAAGGALWAPDIMDILSHMGFFNEGGRVGLANGGVPGSHVAGYTTPAAYNKFDYPSGGVRVAAANGGIMPLLDLGGKEKDYRQDGGFVGIGRKEKADDVPARLSKNEFVFTADAVRNAGGGDIDAGAEVMDNMMKHLESGGQISEESQGIGAQGMYDNMRQLETRIA